MISSINIGELILIKSMESINNIAIVKDIFCNEQGEWLFEVKQLHFSNIYYIKEDDVLGIVTLKEGVNIVTLKEGVNIE